MLILGRKLDEEIVIDGGRITVTVVDIRGDRVKLGVTASREIPVHRGEIARQLSAEGRRHVTRGVARCG